LPLGHATQGKQKRTRSRACHGRARRTGQSTANPPSDCSPRPSARRPARRYGPGPCPSPAAARRSRRLPRSAGLPLRESGGHAVLIAGTGRPALVVVAASGVVVPKRPLPEPVRFPDDGEGYRVSAHGRVVFLGGVTFHRAHGPQVLWRHDRDIRPLPPILDGQTPWLIDDGGITAIDVDGGVVTTVERLPNGTVRATALTTSRAKFASAGGSILAINRAAPRTGAVRVLPQVDRPLASGDDPRHRQGASRNIPPSIRNPAAALTDIRSRRRGPLLPRWRRGRAVGAVR
jgi:hypothetical protein